MFARRHTTRPRRRQLTDLHRAQTAHADTVSAGPNYEEARLEAACALARQYRTLSTELTGPLAVALVHAGELLAQEASDLDDIIAEEQ